MYMVDVYGPLNGASAMAANGITREDALAAALDISAKLAAQNFEQKAVMADAAAAEVATAKVAAAEAREQAISAMRAFVAEPKDGAPELLKKLQASCKASSLANQLAAGNDDLLQDLTKVDGDLDLIQQRRLDIAAMTESSKEIAASMSRMLTVQSMLSGLMDNERVWINAEQLPKMDDDNSGRVFQAYKLNKVEEE